MSLLKLTAVFVLLSAVGWGVASVTAVGYNGLDWVLVHQLRMGVMGAVVGAASTAAWHYGP